MSTFILPLVLLWSGCSHEPKPTGAASAKGAFDDLRAAVMRTVSDPARAAEVAGLVGQLEQLMIEAGEARSANRDRLRVLNADYDATEEDFRAAFKEFNARRDSRRDRILVIDQRARALTTDAEWKALSKDVARALEESVRAEQETALRSVSERRGGKP